MFHSYMIGALLGQFIMGALIGGAVPLIVAIIRRRWKLGIFALITCGVMALVHSWASIICGVVFLIIVIALKPEYTQVKGNKMEDELYD